MCISFKLINTNGIEKAARNGDIEKMMKYIALGANVNWVNQKENGKTCVHIICEGNL